MGPWVYGQQTTWDLVGSVILYEYVRTCNEERKRSGREKLMKKRKEEKKEKKREKA